MKQWVLRLAAVLCAALLLTGCGTPPPTPPVTDGFTCHTMLQYREMTVEGTLVCCSDGGASLAFELPKSLQGVTLGWDGSGMRMQLGGMSVSVPEEKVPEGALIRRLLAVLTASHPGGSLTEEGYIINGEVEGVAYTLVCDPATGLPLSLSVPQEELEAVFTDTTRITE